MPVVHQKATGFTVACEYIIGRNQGWIAEKKVDSSKNHFPGVWSGSRAHCMIPARVMMHSFHSALYFAFFQLVVSISCSIRHCISPGMSCAPRLMNELLVNDDNELTEEVVAGRIMPVKSAMTKEVPMKWRNKL